MPCEIELAGVFFHELLEASERHNPPERYMHSICPGFGTKELCRFVHESRVDLYRRFYSHTLSFFITLGNIRQRAIGFSRPAKTGLCC